MGLPALALGDWLGSRSVTNEYQEGCSKLEPDTRSTRRRRRGPQGG